MSAATLPELVDAGAVTSALARAGRVRQSASLRLEKAWLSGRFPLVTLYRETAGAACRRRSWTVVALPPGPVPGALRNALARGAAVALPQLGAAALCFPHDSELRCLPDVIDARQAARRLAHWTGSPPALGVETLGYKPGRSLVVRYVPLSSAAAADPVPIDPAEARPLIGKCFRRKREADVKAVYAALSGADAGGTASDGPDVARPCGAVPAWSMLVWRPSPGRPFRELLEQPEAPVTAQRIGHALARLHDSSARWQRRHTAIHELAVVHRWTGAAVQAYPGLADALAHAAAELHAALRAQSGDADAALVPAHRDFYDKQVLVDGERVVLLDLETACRAERELDAGNFLAHLRLRRLQGQHLPVDRLRAAFLEGYGEQAAPLGARRLAFYEACALVRLASVYAFRPRWSPLSGELVAAAGTALSASTLQRRSSHVA